MLIEEFPDGFQFRGQERVDQRLRGFFTILKGDFEVIRSVGSWRISFGFTEDIGEVVIVFGDVQ